MEAETILAGTADLFLALGDKTRLRLLNLMREREICVSTFMEVLGQSQPLISRHLAYLRNAGIVEARRDGKWIHYSMSSKLDENTARLLSELFKWMEKQDGLRRDRESYTVKFGPARSRTRRQAPRQLPLELPEISSEQDDLVEVVVAEPDADQYVDVEREELADQYRSRASHNELEDFLL